jgi:LCP family protein required for cell wall assembly
MILSPKNPKYLKGSKKKFSPLPKVAFGLGIILAVIGAAFFLAKSFGKGFSRVGIISKISGAEKLTTTDNRTNFLVLGLDRRNKESTVSGTLTDTIILGSVAEDGTGAVMLSIPRDLWVPYAKSEYSGRINAVYAWGGIAALKETIERILAVPIHYFVVVDFEGFEKAVDAVGGVEVDVLRSFDDFEYPIEGKEDVLPESDRYQHIHFDQGIQIMTGERALQFARSRHAQGDEGTDFARAARQQKIILALKEKVLSAQTFFNPSRIKILYDIFKDSIETNISLNDALAVYDLSKKLDSSQVKSAVLDGELLYNPTDAAPYNGAWVLLPKSGDFSAIQQKVKELFFPAKNP